MQQQIQSECAALFARARGPIAGEEAGYIAAATIYIWARYGHDLGKNVAWLLALVLCQSEKNAALGLLLSPTHCLGCDWKLEQQNVLDSFGDQAMF